MKEGDNLLRALPQVQRLLEHDAALALADAFGRAALTEAIRHVLDEVRAQIRSHGDAGALDEAALLARAGDWLVARGRAGLRPVINATGIVLHTNLGRAPMAEAAAQAAARVATGYSNLEFDLDSGKRGSRTAALDPLLAEVTGAEAALAVNNGAAAILLVLSALARGGEVIVSRGELVEIGGGFRIPEVIAQGGARLVEVGATNKTRLSDYRDAITEDTRVLLKVHQSNFRTIGFTQETGVDELAQLAREHGLVTVTDLGSGLIERVPGTTEPTISEALAAGTDVVTCSGDKLLGGPQAGLILGKAAVVDGFRKFPLLRAVRLDKMTLAALEATLRLQRDRPGDVPVRRMLAQGEGELRARAERLRGMIGMGEVVASQAFAGGGSLPEEAIVSCALAIDSSRGVDALAAALRAGEPAVVGRIERGRLLLDMLTVADGEVEELAVRLKVAMA